MSEKMLLNAREVAALLGVHERSVRRWSMTGDFVRPIRLGRLYRWPKAAVERWIEDRNGKGRRDARAR